MKSILFGSIGSVVESSEIQRKAFNAAFKEFGLEWYWNIANYIKMLQKPGGLNRLIEYSKNELNPQDYHGNFEERVPRICSNQSIFLYLSLYDSFWLVQYMDIFCILN